MKKCDECHETFEWDDDVISIEDEDRLYHRECVHVFPIAYGVNTISDDWIGETEHEDGVMAFELLQKGEYLESESNA